MELSGVSWSSVLCRSNIASGKNQPESNCRAALTTTRCSWTRKISARQTSWPRHHRRRCLRPTIRRTLFANDARSTITALVLTLFTSGPLSSPRAITVHFVYFILLVLVVIRERNRNKKRNAFVSFSFIRIGRILLIIAYRCLSPFISAIIYPSDDGERISKRDSVIKKDVMG